MERPHPTSNASVSRMLLEACEVAYPFVRDLVEAARASGHNADLDAAAPVMARLHEALRQGRQWLIEPGTRLVRCNEKGKPAGKIPEEMLATWVDEVYKLSPAGGGFVSGPLAYAEIWQKYTKVQPELLDTIPYRRGWFGIDGSDKAYAGFTVGHRWNGWAMPYFEKPVAEILTKDLATGKEFLSQLLATQDAHFDSDRNVFNFPNQNAYEGDEGEDEYEEFTGVHITVDGEIKEVWDIGAGSWTWDEYQEEDLAHHNIEKVST